MIKLANEIQKHCETFKGLKSLSHVGKGLTPLHVATMFYKTINLEIIENILEVETIKNPKDTEGNTPLHQAARKGNFEAFLLIKEKVDYINPKNEHGNTPLHGLRTPNEGINQIYLKNWAEVADKICFGRIKKFGSGSEFSAVQ